MNTATRKYSLMVILAAYAVIGGLYATRIPPWQAPDEPAHYNYVRQLAQTGAYPVIEMGDYDQALLSQKVAPPDARPSFPLDAIQYEDHQPPLFYTLAAPVFVAFDGSLVALRLFTLLIGALAVTFTYLAVLEVFPSQPGIAAFAAAWMALLPQHVHMAASLNNDALSEALIALTLWLSARLVMVAGRGAGAGEQGSEGGGAVTRRAPPASRRALVLLGIVVGLSLLTKAQAYLCLPVALAAVFMATHGRQPGRAVARDLGIVLAVGLVLGMPWWLHSMQVYGGLDVLGLQRHNQVVVGQPTTGEWIAQFGWGGLLARMAQTTFQSFWGQFGWMSVPLDRRWYLALLTFTGASAALFILWWLRTQILRPPEAQGASFTGTSAPQRRALTLFALLALGAVLGFLWYNLQFVQHQGRYLYAGLAPIGLAFSLGWHYAFSRWPRVQVWLWAALLAGLAAFNLYLLWRVILPAMAA